MSVAEREFRKVAATFGRQKAASPEWEAEFTAFLRASHSLPELARLFGEFRNGEGPLDFLMRRVLVAASAKRAGTALQIGPGVVFKHIETMEFGDHVFVGAQAMLQGRFDGTCRIGSHVWIGPQAYFDARDLVLEDYVGWGPGAKVLGSVHSGSPIAEPVIATDLVIKPVRVGYGADVGMNASVLPGVHLGEHSIVGAGAAVVQDVPAYAIVAGVPARFIRDRRDGGEQK